MPIKQRLKLIRQDILAATGFRGHKRVHVHPHPLGAQIDVEGDVVVVPSPLRWKLYRKGWHARLDQLAAEYGVGRLAQLDENSVILDIGANAGEFAHVAARYGARIFCVEPDPAVHACLQENIKGLANASAHDALIWKEEADIPFYSAPERADSSVFAEGAGPSQQRRATTVERFCTEHGISDIDLLKCDAEGAEPEVLQGVGAMFANINAVAVDTGRERRGERTHEACRRILEANGFSVSDETVGKRLMTFGVRG